MPSGIYKRKDFTEEHKRNLSISHKGILLGRKHTEESKKIMSIKKMGNKSGFQKGNTLSVGRIVSLETRLKMSAKARKGSDSNLWKGGLTALHSMIRESFEYKLWRTAVFTRDNWTCIDCGIKSVKGHRIELHADHIKSFALFPELRLSINNGRTLCIDCHKKTDTYLNRWYKTNDKRSTTVA